MSPNRGYCFHISVIFFLENLMYENSNFSKYKNINNSNKQLLFDRASAWGVSAFVNLSPQKNKTVLF